MEVDELHQQRQQAIIYDFSISNANLLAKRVFNNFCTCTIASFGSTLHASSHCVINSIIQSDNFFVQYKFYDSSLWRATNVENYRH